ncbi:MAG: hypothetical protein GY710_24535 [Desulfobacteraceae bacterium]|nr:hypothetical protein [Desulfobacteraceae bacterium]
MGSRGTIKSNLNEDGKYIVSYFFNPRCGNHGHAFFTVAMADNQSRSSYSIIGAYGAWFSLTHKVKITIEKIYKTHEQGTMQGLHYPVSRTAAKNVLRFLHHSHLEQTQKLENYPQFNLYFNNCHVFASFCLSMCGIFDERLQKSLTPIKFPLKKTKNKYRLKFHKASNPDYNFQNYIDDGHNKFIYKYYEILAGGSQNIDEDEVLSDRYKNLYDDMCYPFVPDLRVMDAKDVDSKIGVWKITNEQSKSMAPLITEPSMPMQFPESYFNIAKNIVRNNRYHKAKLEAPIRLKIAKTILTDYYTNKPWLHWNRHNTELAKLIVRKINNTSIHHIGELNHYIFNYLYQNGEKFYKTGSFYKRLAFINMFTAQQQFPLPLDPKQHLIVDKTWRRHHTLPSLRAMKGPGLNENWKRPRPVNKPMKGPGIY